MPAPAAPTPLTPLFTSNGPRGRGQRDAIGTNISANSIRFNIDYSKFGDGQKLKPHM